MGILEKRAIIQRTDAFFSIMTSRINLLIPKELPPTALHDNINSPEDTQLSRAFDNNENKMLAVKRSDSMIEGGSRIFFL